MSNPYTREWVSESDEDDGVTIVLDGPGQAVAVEMCWEQIEEEAGAVDYVSRAALRIRHGARAACKRLRGERDEARAGYRWMVEQAADQKLDGYRELGARAAAAENERDAARLELNEATERARALEYAAGYAADLAAIDRVLDQHDAPHDCEDGVSLSPKRIRLLAEERDAARLELRALEWLVVHHPDELRALVLADGSGRYSYCARALGWEG